MALGWIMRSTENLGLLISAAWVDLVAHMPSAGALTVYTAGETPALPGRRASLSSSAICVYLCASVVK